MRIGSSVYSLLAVSPMSVTVTGAQCTHRILESPGSMCMSLGAGESGVPALQTATEKPGKQKYAQCVGGRKEGQGGHSEVKGGMKW